MTLTLSLKYYDLTLYESNLIYVLILHYIFFLHTLAQILMHASGLPQTKV